MPQLAAPGWLANGRYAAISEVQVLLGSAVFLGEKIQNRQKESSGAMRAHFCFAVSGARAAKTLLNDDSSPSSNWLLSNAPSSANHSGSSWQGRQDLIYLVKMNRGSCNLFLGV
jgi:hypothetical protein